MYEFHKRIINLEHKIYYILSLKIRIYKANQEKLSKYSLIFF